MNTGSISQDKVKLNLARIKKFGNTFEINIDPDNAVKYKRGEITDLREVLLADNIFTDAKKGLIASDDDLEQAFHTTKVDEIAKIILTEGEIQVTSEHRAQEREQKKKKLIHLIQQQAIDSKTKLPIPATRLEAAFEEAKIQLVDHKTAEEQFDEVVQKLRPILPISIEKAKLSLTIPAQYTGKAYGFVKSNSKILKEEWTNDGSWKANVELPAGLQQDFIDNINSMTKGEAEVTIE